ncbi:unnamed protein product [Arctia plantaginis]|uniref:Uncharacterized protein n=1 Tax=Arctia plantaginis TaxID=874455 RepID=A0A8S1AQV0_ARCPL|nr:unnamed protein product [Arctia plantaginis]CAB3252500.1 unnamed protein product [Arctia plantaginis]
MCVCVRARVAQRSEAAWRDLRACAGRRWATVDLPLPLPPAGRDAVDECNISPTRERGIADAHGSLTQSGTTWRRRALNSGSPSSWRQSRSSAASPNQRRSRQATDDIPEFDRNKVSLDLPGNLFGPSVSLLIRTTKIIGDVIQNSAVRYQTFLRLFRPLFRGQFEIKGLDPPTTTTTTTTTRRPTTTTASSRDARTADNEVRRR